MKKKQIELLLYSVIGVGAMFLIVVALNFILATFKQRIDLTHEKLYTLSEGTKAILKKLDGPVEIRFYCTQGEKEMPAQFKTYAQQVEDLLSEYRQQGKGKIEIRKLNPKPDSDAEESAHLDGIEGQPLSNGEVLYLGLAISYLDEKMAVPLPPDREKLLEYDITRAISQVGNPKKPVVGVLSSLQMFGMPMNQMMMRMGQQPQEPWAFISELKRDFTVKQLQMDVEKIDDDINVLVVAHPKNISDKTQFAIDQFILRGGKLIAFLDSLSFVDSRSQQNPGMPSMGGGSSMDKLLKAWGITYDSSKVVADLKFAHRTPARPGRPEIVTPTVLVLNAEGVNKEDVATSQNDNLVIPFAGVFTGTPVAGLKQTVLLKTTTQSQLVDGMMAQMPGEQLVKDFKASGTAYPLAIRLTGKFKTAFPEGKPADKEGDKKDEKKADDSLKEAKGETAVILVGDADMLNDQFCVQIQNTIFGRIANPVSGNLGLAQGMVEQMSGDDSLIKVRSRATLSRPFTVVQEMQARAEGEYREKIKKIEDSLKETQQRLNELQTKKETGQRFILSPEQQAALAKFKQEESKAKKDLKEVRKNLRQDIDALENKVKWMNIAGMPLVVTLFGLGIGFFKGQRARAK